MPPSGKGGGGSREVAQSSLGTPARRRRRREGGDDACERVCVYHTQGSGGERKHIRLCMLRGRAFFFLSPQMPPPPPPLRILASPPPAGGFPSSHLVAVYASDFLLIRRRFPAQKKGQGRKSLRCLGVASPWMFDLKGQRSKRLSSSSFFLHFHETHFAFSPREGGSLARTKQRRGRRLTDKRRALNHMRRQPNSQGWRKSQRRYYSPRLNIV